MSTPNPALPTIGAPSVAPATPPPAIQIFATPGSFTWNKPPGTFTVARIIVLNGGNGGGSGAKGDNSASRGGGGGGTGGNGLEITMAFLQEDGAPERKHRHDLRQIRS